LITRDNCRQCQIVQSQLEAILPDFPKVDLSIINLDDPKGKPPQKSTVITPAVWVNDELWSFGKINPDRFRIKLDQLTDVNSK